MPWETVGALPPHPHVRHVAGFGDEPQTPYNFTYCVPRQGQAAGAVAGRTTRLSLTLLTLPEGGICVPAYSYSYNVADV